MHSTLADAIYAIAVAVCAVAQAAILRSVLAVPAHTSSASPTRRAGEIAWAVIPGIALAVLFVYTWRAMHASVIIVGGPTP